MNFEINPNFQTAIKEFQWANLEPQETPLQTILSEVDLESVTNAIAHHIIGASDLRPKLTPMAGRELSLLEVCTIIAQQQDTRTGISTISTIQDATAEEKIALSQTFSKLSVLFEQVKSDDLKGMTLLFGVHRIHDIAKGKIIQIAPEKSILEEKEDALAKLLELRMKFQNVPPEQQAFIGQVDEAISKARREIDALKAEASSESKKDSTVNK